MNIFPVKVIKDSSAPYKRKMAIIHTDSCHLTLIVKMWKYPDFTVGALSFYLVM